MSGVLLSTPLPISRTRVSRAAVKASARDGLSDGSIMFDLLRKCRDSDRAFSAEPGRDLNRALHDCARMPRGVRFVRDFRFVSGTKSAFTSAASCDPGA